MNPDRSRLTLDIDGIRIVVEAPGPFELDAFVKVLNNIVAIHKALKPGMPDPPANALVYERGIE